MSLPEQNSTKKRQINKLQSDPDFKAGNVKKYEQKDICDSAVYGNKIAEDQPS